MKEQAKIRLLRHATLLIEINRKVFLIDPMLSSKNALDPVQNCGNKIRFPMVDLPIDNDELKKLLAEVDAVIITHIHRDHWDISAQLQIEKNKIIFCQPDDSEKIKAEGFKNVQPVDVKLEWEGITIYRTKGQHGTGEIGKRMGKVSGFVFKYKNASIYLAGDTIWCEDVKNSLSEFKPGVTILNAGGAKFLTGDPITMVPDDIIEVQKQLPQTKIIAVHMDTVNHCFITRAELLKALANNSALAEIMIPGDGETINV
jgi:L-ascorbate metabolism protein UlaG (beta-lactamase superfamily)